MLTVICNDYILEQIKERNLDINVLKEFCTKHDITMLDLFFRKFIVDGSEPCTLIDLLIINTEAVMIDSILDLDNEFPLKEILLLNIGETYSSFHSCDVKRIKFN